MSHRIDDLGNSAKNEHSENASASPTSAFLDAYDFCAATLTHPDARLRQTAVALDGCFVGAMKEVPIQLTKHPVETAEKALIAGASAAVFGAVIATGSPFLAGSALVCGGVLTGIGLYDSWTKVTADGTLKTAMTQAWNSSDAATLAQSKSVAEDKLGLQAFDLGLAAACTGSGAAWGAKLAVESLAKPRWYFTPARVWEKAADGTRTYEDMKFGHRKDTLFPDGTLKSERQGMTTTHHANGPTVDEYSNGVKQTRYRDGRIETSHGDGRKITEDSFHHRTIEMPNGTRIEQSPDHTVISRPDGSFTSKQIDGRVYKKFPNGDSLTRGQDGSVTFYNAAEGKMYITKANGEKSVL
jgi:hypothetical protein